MSFRTRFGTFTEVLTLFPSVYSTTFAPSITEVFFAGTCSVTKTEFAFTPSGIVTLKPKFSSDFFASVNVLLITSGTFAVLAEATPALVVLEFSDAIPMYGSTSVNMFDKIGAAILLPYGFSVAGLYTTTSPTNLGSSAGAIAVYETAYPTSGSFTGGSDVPVFPPTVYPSTVPYTFSLHQ